MILVPIIVTSVFAGTTHLTGAVLEFDCRRLVREIVCKTIIITILYAIKKDPTKSRVIKYNHHLFLEFLCHSQLNYPQL